MYDVIIVGAGPAGLAAALTLGRMRRRVLVVDAGEPRNAASPAMHNFLTRDGTAPAEFRAAARAELRAYSSVVERAGRVAGAERGADGTFIVRLDTGDELEAARLLIAAGVADELPAIEGLAEHWGSTVLHCPYCHGWEVRDSPVGVIGGTPDRARIALMLTQLSDDVVLFTNGEPQLDVATRDTVVRAGVVVREEAVIRVARRTGMLRVELSSGAEVARAALFVPNAVRQRNELARALGCTILEDGSIRVDDVGRTDVEGVFAAGDVARRETMDRPAWSVIAAAAAGSSAGAALDQSLLPAADAEPISHIGSDDLNNDPLAVAAGHLPERRHAP